MRAHCTAISAIVASLAAGPAFAGGFFITEQSATYEGAAFAGAAARADDPSTLFFNPAGMALLPGIQVQVDGTYIDPQATITLGRASTAAVLGGTPISGTTGQGAALDAVVPDLYITAALGQSPWHVGFSVTSPFGLTTKYPSDSIARYYALTTTLRTQDYAASLSYQVAPTLALGASAIVESAQASLSSAINMGSIGLLHGLGPLAAGLPDGVSTLSGNSVAFGYQLGALWQPDPATHVGLSYRSPFFHTFRGNVTFQNIPAFFAGAFQGSPTSLNLPEPDIISLGVTHEIGKWTLLAGLDWTHWGRFHSLYAAWPGGSTTTSEHWHDTWTASIGADYRLNDQWTLRGGFAFDQTPVSSTYVTPRIPDGNRYWLAVGATYKPTPRLSLSAAYVHIFVQPDSVNLTDAGPGTENFLRGNLSASYSEAIDIAALSATYAF